VEVEDHRLVLDAVDPANGPPDDGIGQEA
jgi:hypothetical protein